MLRSKEDNIRRIRVMEDRILNCRRCRSLSPCIIKPSLGRGELNPHIMCIFESENSFTRDSQAIIKLRKIIREQMQAGEIYHTYLVRCQPKACALRQNLDFYTDNSYNIRRLLDKNLNCFINEKKCSGIPVKPSNEEIIFCLPYLLEEIEILKPQSIILFGERVAEYVSKACGFFNQTGTAHTFHKNGITYASTCCEENFGIIECEELKHYF